VPIRDLDLSGDDFANLGADFARETTAVRSGRVGQATALLMPQRELIDYAVRWLEPHRGEERPREPVTIRPAARGDREEWLRLRTSLWPRHDPEELRSELDAMLADGSREVAFVAEEAPGRLTGFVEVSLRDSAQGCASHPVGYIEGWYVDPARRREGFGRRLIDAAESWARGRGCTEMASDTTPEYEGSLEAHVALGYERIDITQHFRKLL
jgi:aminoglycoside 6'-N-acetyltransferase I